MAIKNAINSGISEALKPQYTAAYNALKLQKDNKKLLTENENLKKQSRNYLDKLTETETKLNTVNSYIDSLSDSDQILSDANSNSNAYQQRILNDGSNLSKQYNDYYNMIKNFDYTDAASKATLDYYGALSETAANDGLAENSSDGNVDSYAAAVAERNRQQKLAAGQEQALNNFLSRMGLISEGLSGQATGLTNLYGVGNNFNANQFSAGTSGKSLDTNKAISDNELTEAALKYAYEENKEKEEEEEEKNESEKTWLNKSDYSDAVNQVLSAVYANGYQDIFDSDNNILDDYDIAGYSSLLYDAIEKELKNNGYETSAIDKYDKIDAITNLIKNNAIKWRDNNGIKVK